MITFSVILKDVLIHSIHISVPSTSQVELHAQLIKQMINITILPILWQLILRIVTDEKVQYLELLQL